jgi:phosphoglycolate phosphatase-like HAD superfamily hydrolase
VRSVWYSGQDRRAGIWGVTMRRLVLFDIDGTLVNTGRAGADAATMAFAELYRIADGFAGIRMSGKTDRLIYKRRSTITVCR